MVKLEEILSKSNALINFLPHQSLHGGNFCSSFGSQRQKCDVSSALIRHRDWLHKRMGRGKGVVEGSSGMEKNMFLANALKRFNEKIKGNH